MRQILMLAMGVLLVANLATAQDKPTSEETRKVINYYYHGKGGGTVLMDHYLCQEIGQEGPDKNECLNKLNPSQIQKEQEAYLWMNFLVPMDASADIIVSFSRKGKVRRTASVKLSGATRFRTWKRIPTNKAGQWSVVIIQEMEDKDMEVGSLQYTIAEPSQ